MDFWWSYRTCEGKGSRKVFSVDLPRKREDTTATHAWVRQLPECNGRLGAYGFSYQGLTQLTAAESAPPPDCTAPAMTGLDERRHWSCEGGAHWWHLGLGWGLQLAALQAQRRGDATAWLEIRRSLENNSYLRDGPALLQRHDPDGMAWRWLQSDPSHNVQDWTVHSPPPELATTPNAVDRWMVGPAPGGPPGPLAIAAGSRRRCILLSTLGRPPTWSGGRKLKQLMLQFFQQHLQDRSPLEPMPVHQLWNITRHRWDSFPGADTNAPASWGLRSLGLACIDPNDGVLMADEAGEGSVTIVHDPWRPVPAIGGHLGTSPGPADRMAVDQRSDVATFTTSPLVAELLLAGQPLLQLKAHADQPGFDLCISLSRLPADANGVEQLSTGVVRVQGKDALQPARRSVILQPLQATLAPGDRLRISVAAAAWPAIGVNPGHDGTPCGAPGPEHRVVTLTLELADSSLQLNPFDSGKLKLD